MSIKNVIVVIVEDSHDCDQFGQMIGDIADTLQGAGVLSGKVDVMAGLGITDPDISTTLDTLVELIEAKVDAEKPANVVDISTAMH